MLGGERQTGWGEGGRYKTNSLLRCSSNAGKGPGEVKGVGAQGWEVGGATYNQNKGILRDTV